LATSLSVTEATRNKLMILKMEEGYPSVEALLNDMIVKYKKMRLEAVGTEFRRRMKRKKLKPRDLVK